MGYYVNPQDQSKEGFLRSKGILAPSSRFSWSDVPSGFLPVALIDNGPFTAAGICYSERELAEFQDPTDTRPMEFYFVRITELLPVTETKFHKYAIEQGWVETTVTA